MQNPEHQNPDYQNPDQFYAIQQFGASAISGEFLIINHIFDENGKPHQQYQMIMHVTDQMDFKLIKQEFFKHQELQSTEIYNLESQRLVYELDFCIDDQTTVKQFKQKINQPKLFGQFLLRLYDESDPFFIKLESSLDYDKFQKSYKGNAQITLKFINPQKYLYLEVPFVHTMGQLRKMIQQKKNSQQYGIKIKEKIVFKKQITNQQSKKLLKQGVQIKQQGGKKFRIITQNQDYKKVRSLVSFGQILLVQSKNAQLISNKQKNPFKKDLWIQIQIYSGHYTSNSEKKSLLKKENIKFKVPYEKIRFVKVKTLLKEQDVPNFMQISLISQNYFILKPIDMFKKLQESTVHIKDEIIKLQGITQNLLFYREVRNFNKIQNVSPKELLDLMMSSQTSIKQSHRQTFQKKVEQRVKAIQQEPYKQKNFLHPIVLYTSPLIYNSFNLFSRQTTPSQFDLNNKQMRKKFSWQYPFSQKLIKSLEKIPNYRGIVYRGMKGVKFEPLKGEIIQFNSFTSTSMNQKVARGFLGNNETLRVLITIQTFTGKQIKKFSYYQKQDQVLLFPYTKFKVIRSQQKNLIQQIDLLQIPVPKKIPGDIVVWVDANMKENYNTFLRSCYKNNINNLQIVQLKSNEHLQIWIKQYKAILNMPNINVYYITNLNRTKQRLGEGIETLRIIRQLNKKAQVVFYIGDIMRTLQLLKNKGYGQDSNIRVISHPKDLDDIIFSWKRTIVE